MQYIFLILFTTVCLADIVFGIYLINKLNTKIKKCTLRVIGKVIEVETERKYDNYSEHPHSYYVYHPIVSCNIYGNEVIRKLDGSPNQMFRTNEEIELFFNPDDYSDFYSMYDKSTKGIGIVIICIGTFMLLLIWAVWGIPLLFYDVFLKTLVNY